MIILESQKYKVYFREDTKIMSKKLFINNKLKKILKTKL